MEFPVTIDTAGGVAENFFTDHQQNLSDEPWKKNTIVLHECKFSTHFTRWTDIAGVLCKKKKKTHYIKCLSCSEPWVAFHNVLAPGKASIAPRGHPAWGQRMQWLPFGSLSSGEAVCRVWKLQSETSVPGLSIRGGLTSSWNADMRKERRSIKILFEKKKREK